MILLARMGPVATLYLIIIPHAHGLVNTLLESLHIVSRMSHTMTLPVAFLAS